MTVPKSGIGHRSCTAASSRLAYGASSPGSVRSTNSRMPASLKRSSRSTLDARVVRVCTGQQATRVDPVRAADRRRAGSTPATIPRLRSTIGYILGDELSFGSPLLLVTLLAVPVTLGLVVLARRRSSRYAVSFPNLAVLERVVARRGSWRRALPLVSLLLAVSALGIALARPQVTFLVPTERATVVLVIDTSRSMLSEDVQAVPARGGEEGSPDVPEPRARTAACRAGHLLR